MYAQTSAIDTLLQKIFTHALMVRNELATKANLNVTEIEFLATVFLAGKQLSVKEVSSQLHLCSQAVTKISKNLRSLGLIATHKSLVDKRSTLISLTESGQKLAQLEKNKREVLLLRCLQTCSIDDIDKFCKVLSVVHGSLHDLMRTDTENVAKERFTADSSFSFEVEMNGRKNLAAG